MKLWTSHKKTPKSGKAHLILLSDRLLIGYQETGEKLTLNRLCGFGGEGGIRTPVTLPGKLDFESSAFSRARPPLRFCLVPLVLSQTAKKVSKNCRAVLGEYPTRDWQPVIQRESSQS